MSPSELWQKILAAPADTDLKTQYAAALIAAGDDPRAELASHSAAWHGEVRFVSGWPMELTIAAADFASHAAEIVATVPIRHLNLTAISEFPAVFGVTQFQQIASLDGSRQRWSDDAIGALANSGHLGALRWLDLSRCRITEAQIELLAASPGLRTVVMLNLSDNRGRDPVDAAAGYGTEWATGAMIPESIHTPRFGSQLESRYGKIPWLHALDMYRDRYPPSRYLF